jgi:iron(III) transport system substrate-binding protein
MRAAFLATLAVVLLLACESKSPGPPVIVYAAYPEGPYLAEYFLEFTAQTGTPVTVIFGESSLHVDMILDNRGSPSADVFITREIEHLWRAGDRGALRPIQGKKIAAVPAFLKDGENLWAATNYQFAVIASRSPLSDAWPLTYAELADPGFRGQVCVSSANLPVNRSLIAMLIDEIGSKKAERTVRGWMSNLAMTPFETDRKLLAAIETGDCRFGLLSGWINGAAHSSQADVATQILYPEPSYVEIEGVGIARHSRNPDAAQALVDWLLSESSNQQHALALRAYSIYGEVHEFISQKNAGIAGWRDEDARLLAERAGYH